MKRESGKKEASFWQVMRPQHQLLFAATAAQRALSRPPARGCEAALRVLRGPGPRPACRDMLLQSICMQSICGICGAPRRGLPPHDLRRKISAKCCGGRRPPASSTAKAPPKLGARKSRPPTFLRGPGSDATFSHPFVKAWKQCGGAGTGDLTAQWLNGLWQELLREAQARVSWDNWVICVRTYARRVLLSRTPTVEPVSQPDLGDSDVGWAGPRT